MKHEHTHRTGKDPDTGDAESDHVIPDWSFFFHIYKVPFINNILSPIYHMLYYMLKTNAPLLLTHYFLLHI